MEERRELPVKTRTTAENRGTGIYRLLVEGELKGRLEDFVKIHRLTLAGLFYGAWGILMQKYGGQEDVLFGTTVSGRSAKIKGIEEMVGLFINTLPLRVRFGRGETLLDLVSRVEVDLLAREAFENTPLPDIFQYLRTPGGVSLFDTLVVVENYPLDNRLLPVDSGLQVNSFTISESTHYDLTVGILLFNEMEIKFHYNTTCFTTETMTNMAGHFLRILHAILERGETKLTQLEW